MLLNRQSIKVSIAKFVPLTQVALKLTAKFQKQKEGSLLTGA